MAIGNQSCDGATITEKELRERFDHLIKEAISKADPLLEITRADDVAQPGSISNDVFLRLMHADVVVADVTYPNPNVFYE